MEPDLVIAVRANPATSTLPVIVATSKMLSAEERQQLSGQVPAIFPKGNLKGNAAVAELRAVLESAGLDNIFESEPKPAPGLGMT